LSSRFNDLNVYMARRLHSAFSCMKGDILFEISSFHTSCFHCKTSGSDDNVPKKLQSTMLTMSLFGPKSADCVLGRSDSDACNSVVQQLCIVWLLLCNKKQ
jgi:hypothetical protein